MSINGFAIFCDDIRFETTGKAILIGVYSEDLVPSVLPQVIPLSFWIRFKGLPPGDTELKLSIGFNGKTLHTIEATLSVQDGGKPVNLYFAGIPVGVEESGEVFVEVSGFKDEYVFKEYLRVMPAQS